MIKKRFKIDLLVVLFFYILYLILPRFVSDINWRYSLGIITGIGLIIFFKDHIFEKLKIEKKDLKKHIFDGIKVFFIFYLVFLSLITLVSLIQDHGKDFSNFRLVYEGSINYFELVAFILFFPIIEEIFYRFILDFMLKTKIGNIWFRNIIISVLFAFGHTSARLKLFIWSFFVTYIYQKKNSLIQVIVFHILSIFLYYGLIFGFAEFK